MNIKADNLLELLERFPTEEACVAHLCELRWPDGEKTCPYCGESRIYDRSDGRFRCKECQRNFSVKVGTIFESSRVPLQKWFIGIWLLMSNRKGISSYALARQISVAQKTKEATMLRLFAVLILVVFGLSLPASLVADVLNEEDGKPLDLPDIAAIMQTAFKVVGSPISPQQYLHTLEREQTLSRAGLDPSLARNEKTSGFSDQQWALADKGLKRSLAGFQLMRSGIGLIKTLDILEYTKDAKVERGLDLLIATFRTSGRDIDSVAVDKVMADARKMRDAGGEGSFIFAAHGIDLNFPLVQRERGQ